MPFYKKVAHFYQRLRELGFAGALRKLLKRFLGSEADVVPLSRADKTMLFAVHTEEIRAQEKLQMRQTSMLYDASRVEATYPLVYEWKDRFMRYAFFSATKKSRGLVVFFHGHNAYLHLGPVSAWEWFDILAPWDTFGWNRQGSWFWGELGNGFVAEMVRNLIDTTRTEMGQPSWFCMGGSMGGFGALYHGITQGCDGIYITSPQVDLRAKVMEYGKDNRDNPYGYLQGDNLETVPDLMAIADSNKTLPPLYLVQHQYDPVNPFSDHAFRLLDIYNRKKAWYGVRVHPAIGHTSDGSQREAELFFSLLAQKVPPQRVPF
jgi:hypothetical protein